MNIRMQLTRSALAIVAIGVAFAASAIPSTSARADDAALATTILPTVHVFGVAPPQTETWLPAITVYARAAGDARHLVARGVAAPIRVTTASVAAAAIAPAAAEALPPLPASRVDDARIRSTPR
jgi:hypothetical protein